MVDVASGQTAHPEMTIWEVDPVSKAKKLDPITSQPIPITVTATWLTLTVSGWDGLLSGNGSYSPVVDFSFNGTPYTPGSATVATNHNFKLPASSIAVIGPVSGHCTVNTLKDYDRVVKGNLFNQQTGGQGSQDSIFWTCYEDGKDSGTFDTAQNGLRVEYGADKLVMSVGIALFGNDSEASRYAPRWVEIFGDDPVNQYAMIPLSDVLTYYNRYDLPESFFWDDELGQPRTTTTLTILLPRGRDTG